MLGRTFTATVVAALLPLLVELPSARGAPCARACKDEVTACIGAECQGLAKRRLRRCKRRCNKSIVRDCFADLSVCGATSARPPRSPGSGQPAPGGW
jgi:hypothetical protein